MTERAHFEATTTLSAAQVAAVEQLIERVTALDGVRPLSERVIRHVRSSTSDEYLDICASIGPTLLGYAAVDRSNSPDYPAVEMAVDGAGRALGVDGELLDRALQKADGRLELWAHGRTASAARLAQSRGFIKSRELFRMRRSLREALPDAPILDSIAIRPFEASTDVEAWLELNRRAFVDLPDQGEWTESDLRLRLSEDWFDPDGFLLAHEIDADGSEGALLGFHWTKVHQHSGESGDADQPVGEVYVLGIDPDQQGRGLGRALTIAGLQHLQRQEIDEAILYVESDNAAALATYERLGFTIYNADALYRSPDTARH